MSRSDNACLAEAVVDKNVCFETALAESRRIYPLAEFNAFVRATRLYIESIGRGNLIDRRVASILYGLSEYLRLERKRFQLKCSRTCSDLSACFSMATILISKGMNLQGFDARERPAMQSRRGRKKGFGPALDEHVYDMATTRSSEFR
jgi:hypothetical protein